MLMSASAMLPVSGLKKTRVRAVVESKLNCSFSTVSAMVTRLTPSPPSAGLTEVAEVQVTTKLMLARLDQRASARFAAPTTSLSGLMFAPGVSSEFEKATSMVRLGQRIRLAVWGAGSNSEESRVSSRSPAPRARNRTTLTKIAAGYCIATVPGEDESSVKPGSWTLGGRPTGESYHALPPRFGKICRLKPLGQSGFS